MKTTAFLPLVLLALAGAANAQTCPECDPDGAPSTNSSFTSVDLGALTLSDGVLADTDASFSDLDNETFFAWLSICLSAWLGTLSEALGLDANADVYVSEHGLDADATVLLDDEVVLDLDTSPVGGVDDATWSIVGETREATGLDLDGGVGSLLGNEHAIDICLYAEVRFSACP